jgi:hypothetical protein
LIIRKFPACPLDLKTIAALLILGRKAGALAIADEKALQALFQCSTTPPQATWGGPRAPQGVRFECVGDYRQTLFFVNFLRHVLSVGFKAHRLFMAAVRFAFAERGVSDAKLPPSDEKPAERAVTRFLYQRMFGALSSAGLPEGVLAPRADRNQVLNALAGFGLAGEYEREIGDFELRKISTVQAIWSG